ncbi:MAG: hypothetical protein NXI29_11205 [bacterium]|nr:hypothetical protein [bacterium]
MSDARVELCRLRKTAEQQLPGMGRKGTTAGACLPCPGDAATATL